MGGEYELFRKGGAQLYLVDGDESMLLQRGEFVLLLVKHSGSPLAAVVAMVGDMQWPVGKDSPVSKLGHTGFSFSNLPAQLSYALALDHLEGEDLQKLVFLFGEYSSYKHADGEANVEAAGIFWTRLARSGNTVVNFASGGRGLPDVACELQGERRASKMDTSSTMLSSMLAQRMQQARRMSAVAKLFVRSVERGAINASTHVKKVNSTLDLWRPTGAGRVYTEMALASVDAVAKVVEAVETAGRTLQQLEKVEATEQSEQSAGSMQEAVSSLISSTAWTLNKVGLRMLFRTIASINMCTAAYNGIRRSAPTSGRSSASSYNTDAGAGGSGFSSSTSSCKSINTTPSADLSTCNTSIAQVCAALRSPGTLVSSTDSNNIARAYGGRTTTSSFDGTARNIKAESGRTQPINIICRPQPCAAAAGGQPLPSRFGAGAISSRPPAPPPPMPPRFHGASTDVDAHCDKSVASSGVTTALSLGTAGGAAATSFGPRGLPPSFQHVLYRPQPTAQLRQPHSQVLMGMPPPAGPPPPPPVPRPRAPFHY